MSSSIFFRFKSSKEPSRVAFDGTGISVFELKREIILMNRLGDGTDFELILCAEDSKQEYDDDTSIIPRSTTVIAKRLPAAKSGRGSAAKYVSGKMPQNAKNSRRQENHSMKPQHGTQSNQAVAVAADKAHTEEDRIKAVFQMGADQWAQEQQTMASAIPIHRGGPLKGKPQNVPDHDPPSGYICYRCGEKGHWIMLCPTNNDPTFDSRPRVKRTTGIPRSFLKIVEKPSSITNDGTVDETKQPSGIMINAEGDWVVAEPDKATWDTYQAKAKESAAAQSAAELVHTKWQSNDLECKIDKQLFANPVKTPCCHKTFCHDCITNVLLDNDLRCPECLTDDVPLDDLVPDQEMSERIKMHVAQATSGVPADPIVKDEVISDAPRYQHIGKEDPERLSFEVPDIDSHQRKRRASADLTNSRRPKARPGVASDETPKCGDLRSTADELAPHHLAELKYSSMMPGLNGIPPQATNNNMMGTPPNTNFLGPIMTMPNTMTMPNGPLISAEWHNLWSQAQMPQGIALGWLPSNNGSMQNFGYNPQNNFGQINANVMTSNGASNSGISGLFLGPAGRSPHTQQTSTSILPATEEDSAYFRQPVNPHRHQGKRSVNRPAEYREI